MVCYDALAIYNTIFFIKDIVLGNCRGNQFGFILGGCLRLETLKQALSSG